MRGPRTPTGGSAWHSARWPDRALLPFAAVPDPGRIRVCLSIAGSDSGGGAGIQADLKAFARAGVHGTTAITAITAQNTVGVTGVDAVSPAMIVAQVRAVVEDIGVDAVKIGMLGSVATARAVGAALDLLAPGTPVVLDPVMVAESGARLLDEDAQAALVELVARPRDGGHAQRARGPGARRRRRARRRGTRARGPRARARAPSWSPAGTARRRPTSSSTATRGRDRRAAPPRRRRARLGLHALERRWPRGWRSATTSSRRARGQARRRGGGPRRPARDRGGRRAGRRPRARATA